LVVFPLVLTETAHAGGDREPGMEWPGCNKMSRMLDEEDFSGSQFNPGLRNLKASNFN